MNGLRKLALLTVALVAPTACTTVVMESPPSAQIGAQLSVERFLNAANQGDVRAMGRLFGTSDGAAMDTGSTFGCAFKKIGSWFGGSSCRKKRDVEVRMDAIASILRHQDYRVAVQGRVAGRDADDPGTRVMVDLTMLDGADARNVPFVVVQTNDGRWLVEQVDLQAVMAAR